jgi:chlorite dismutase
VSTQTPVKFQSNPAPCTLEGFAVLHQFFHLKHDRLRHLSSDIRTSIIAEATETIAAMTRCPEGDTALFAQLGHKGDLIIIHFRRTLDELSRAEQVLTKLRLSEYLEQSHSYLSVIEIGLYEATVKMHRELSAQGLVPHTPAWDNAVVANLAGQRDKLAARLWTPIPDRRYVCFYPMNKRRQGADNWYMLPLEERQRLMHEHGLIGRRYAGRVNQVISGSIGFDDWEWGVDLFTDDPLVFKQLVYEMRFDESSARYGEFGPFYVGIRLDVSELPQFIGA